MEGLKISDDKKKYILEKLNPVLEEMVVEALTNLPEDTESFMIEYLSKKSGTSSGGTAEQRKENAELKQELKALKGKMQSAGAMLASTAEAEKEEEEEEEDDADELDEMPASFERPAGAGGRQSVSAEAYGAWNQKKAFTAPVHPKSDEQKNRLREVLSKSFLFANLEDKDLSTVIDAMQEVICETGDRPIRQGDDGDFLFVVESGSLECYIKQKDSSEEKMVKRCEAGDAFGELALLYNTPRAASVQAAERCVLWKLDRESFNHIVKDAAAKKRELYEGFLQSVALLATLPAYERSQVADALKSESYQDREAIVKEGDPGDKFYILEEGNAVATKEQGEVMQYKPGDYFGELALIRNQPRAATVTAKGAVRVLSLDRRSFRRLLGPLDELMNKYATKYDTTA